VTIAPEAFHRLVALQDAQDVARSLKTAMTRLRKAEEDFIRWQRGYHREERQWRRRITKLQASVLRFSGKGGDAGPS